MANKKAGYDFYDAP